MSFSEDKTYKEQSRRKWWCEPDPNENQLKLGCLQRIADATELMAQNYQSLIGERDSYKRKYEAERDRRLNQDKCNAALRGVITKMKKKAVDR